MKTARILAEIFVGGFAVGGLLHPFAWTDGSLAAAYLVLLASAAGCLWMEVRE